MSHSKNTDYRGCHCEGEARSNLNSTKGVTLIELVISIAVIGVLVLATSTILIYLMRLLLYVPNELSVSRIGEAALDAIIEGDQNALGLRFVKDITAASDNALTFTDADDKTVSFTLSSGRISRSVNGGPSAVLPYYTPSSVTISGPTQPPAGYPDIIFSYLDSNEGTIPSPVSSGNLGNIRRVKVSLVVKTGTGDFNRLEGQIALVSGAYTGLNR